MSSIKRIEGKPRLRYRIMFPDGGWADRSRRYRIMALANAKWPMAQELEDKTRYDNYTSRDIDQWRKAGLLNDEDIERLGFNPELKTFDQAIKDYRASWDVSDQEARSREARLKNILTILKGNTRIKTMRYADGLDLKKGLKAMGLKTVSVRKHIQDLRRIFRLQLANQTIEFNPFADLGAGKIGKEEKFKPCALTEKEISKALEKAGEKPTILGGWLYTMLLVLFGCGVRLGELLKLRWEYIDWDDRSIYLPEEITKTGKGRQVGLGQRLFYELLLRKKNDGLIFPPFHTTSVSRAIRLHFKECGIKARPHDARHTYTTMIQDYLKPKDAMQRTGHESMTTLSRYTHGQLGPIIEDEFSFMKVPESRISEA